MAKLIMMIMCRTAFYSNYNTPLPLPKKPPNKSVTYCTISQIYESPERSFEIRGPNTRFEIRDSKFEILYSISKLANQILELKPVSLLHKTVLNKDH